MVTIAPHVSWHPVDGELALFDMRDGTYHILNTTAAAIWRGLIDTQTPAACAEALAARYGAPHAEIREGIDAFIALALEKGLLVEEA